MNRFLLLFSSLLFMVWLPGCNTGPGLLAVRGQSLSAPARHLHQSALDRLDPVVRNELEHLSGSHHSDWLTAHEHVDRFAAKFKRRLAVNTLKQPWSGLSDIEHQGLLLADMAAGGAVNLPALLDVLEAGMDRTSAFYQPIPLPTKVIPGELLDFMIGSLEQASRYREKALSGLTETERHFLFLHARAIAEHFIPQLSNLSASMKPRVISDFRFAELLEERVDYAGLIAAAQVLARLANERWVHLVSAAWTSPLPASSLPSGITGDILLVQESAYGLIVIGGPGPNTYALNGHIGLIIDVGGHDLYRGMIASSGDEEQGNAVVIDLSGNDTYEGAPLGLATGRLGVGLLIDHDGNDVYQLGMGSGGAGFGGLGILFDAKGNDIYRGNRLTQGVAIGGLGLLLDAAGNDRYTSYGYAIGFGGPIGVGAVIDITGDDDYQCGNAYPSAYNAEDAPAGKPGDPLYQYDCFGLGAGSGLRVFSKRPEWQAYSLAGGMGILLDKEGHDNYDSANFSQGLGYFFGVGMKLDLQGNDEHRAARYGHGASAHFGVGLFLDHQGDDHYGSSGPYYNGGTAWDNSVSLMLDAGTGRDTYTFDRSTGLGRADYAGWGLFIDEGGADRYHAASGFGDSTEKSVSGFFDLEGKDSYTLPPDSSISVDSRPGDGRFIFYPHGGVFADR
ncbi:MAG: hypothetical protein OEV08_07045 [Nitrospira sp.]|nr:hypothetical protein [Nitrospira sp.]